MFSASHPSIFTAVGLAFAAGMTLVILIMLILEKDTDARVTGQPAVAVAVNGGTSTVTARSAMEGEMPKAIGNGPPVETGSGVLPIEPEQPVPAAR